MLMYLLLTFNNIICHFVSSQITKICLKIRRMSLILMLIWTMINSREQLIPIQTHLEKGIKAEVDF